MVSVRQEIKSFFLSGLRKRSKEIQNKAKYIIYSDFLLFCFWTIQLFSFLFEKESKYIVAGQLIALLMILLSLFEIKRKRLVIAGNLTTFSILTVAFFTYVLNDYFYSEQLSYDKIFELISFLLLGCLFLGFFAVKSSQIGLFVVSGFFLLVIDYIIISDKFYEILNQKVIISLFSGLLIFLIGAYLSWLFFSKTHSLIKVVNEAKTKSQIKYHALFKNLPMSFLYLKIIYDPNHLPFDARIIEMNDRFKNLMQTTDTLINTKISDNQSVFNEIFGNWNEFLLMVYERKKYTTDIYINLFNKRITLSTFFIDENHFAILINDLSQ